MVVLDEVRSVRWIAAWVVALAACGGDDSGPRGGADASPDATDTSEETGDAGVDTGADTGPACNDGELTPDEACEGFDLRGNRCEDLGFTGGRLSCATDCTFDTSACTTCGDDTADNGEVCDGRDTRGATCADLLGPDASGTVACTSDCRTLLYDDCASAAPAPELFACDPDAATPCDDALDCVETAVGAYCLEACDNDRGCDEGDYCRDQGAGESACVPRPEAGQTCDETVGCGAEASCVAAFDDVSVCAVTCDPRLADDCADGEVCVIPPAGPLDVGDSGDCTEAGGTCDEGFDCVPDGGGTCVAPIGICAAPSTLYTFGGAGPQDDMICDLAGPSAGGRFCGGIEGTAFASCYPIFGDDTPLGACVGLCDDGTVGGGEDRTCGDGWTCGLPEAPELYFPPDPLVSCDTAGAAGCPGDYPECVDFGDGPTCVRASRLCVPEADR